MKEIGSAIEKHGAEAVVNGTTQEAEVVVIIEEGVAVKALMAVETPEDHTHPRDRKTKLG